MVPLSQNEPYRMRDQSKPRAGSEKTCSGQNNTGRTAENFANGPHVTPPMPRVRHAALNFGPRPFRGFGPIVYRTQN